MNISLTEIHKNSDLPQLETVKGTIDYKSSKRLNYNMPERKNIVCTYRAATIESTGVKQLFAMQ